MLLISMNALWINVVLYTKLVTIQFGEIHFLWPAPHADAFAVANTAFGLITLASWLAWSVVQITRYIFIVY